MKLPQAIVHVLDGVRRRHLGVQLLEFPLMLLAVIAVAWTFQAVVDRVFELSWTIRALLLSLDGIAAAVLFWFFAIRPFVHRLDRKQAALLIERTVPEFRSSLISSVELAEKSADSPSGSRSLVEKLLEDTTRELRKSDIVGRVIRLKRLKRFSIWTVAGVLLAGVCFMMARPYSPFLARRILLSRVELPKDTVVADVTGAMWVVAGSDLELIAKAVGKIPGTARLRITLADGRMEFVPLTGSRTETGTFKHTVKNIREPFSYRFELNDGVGKNYRVNVRIPPTLRAIDFVQTYPKYTGMAETKLSPAGLRLVAGSKLAISATSSGPLTSAVLEIKGGDGDIPLTVSGDGKSIASGVLTVPTAGWKSISLRLTDESGESSVNNPVYQVTLTKDQPPVVLLTRPKKNEITVVAGATVSFAFKVSDDFGLKRAALAYRVLRHGLGGVDKEAEYGEMPIALEPGVNSFSRTMDWDLSRLVPPVTTGSKILCWIEAEDHNPGKNVAITRGSQRTITIVSEEQKRIDLLEFLGKRAEDIEKLYEQQREMNQTTDDSIR